MSSFPQGRYERLYRAMTYVQVIVPAVDGNVGSAEGVGVKGENEDNSVQSGKTWAVMTTLLVQVHIEV